MRWLLTALLGIAMAVFLVGVSVVALTAPAFTHYVALNTSEASQAGLSQARMLQVAEQVRRFVTDADAPALPATVDGRPGFDAGAVSHLVDVRGVLGGASVVTGLLAALLAVVIGIEVARTRTAFLADALVVGAIVSVVLVVLGAVAATSNFDAFFTAFHGLFFKAGTWAFSADSLLIETFPEPFWMTCGVAWATLVALGAGAMGVTSWALRRGVRAHAESVG
jgi:integral membrane protein (TIGR01906 family)